MSRPRSSKPIQGPLAEPCTPVVPDLPAPMSHVAGAGAPMPIAAADPAGVACVAAAAVDEDGHMTAAVDALEAGTVATVVAVAAAGVVEDVHEAGAAEVPAALMVRRRIIVNTKLRTLLARAADPADSLNSAERDRLVLHHKVRLGTRRSVLRELLDMGEIRLRPGDPGDGPILPALQDRADVWRVAAARLGPGSSLDDVLRVRRIHHLVRPPSAERPPEVAIAAGERFMCADPSVHDYTRLLCGGALAQVLAAERKSRIGGSHRYAQSGRDADVEALLAKAPAELRGYMERRGLGVVRKVPPNWAAQLIACRDPLLFGVGLVRLELFLRQPVSRHAYHQMLLVKQAGNCAHGYDLATLDGMDAFARAYCLDRTIFPKDPETRRHGVGKFLLESHVLIDREVRAAEPADAAMLSRYLLPLPRMPQEFARQIAKAQRKQVDDGRRTRKDRVEPLAQKLPEARFLAGSRVAELVHDERCCAEAVAEAAKLDVTGPIEVSFSYRAPIFDEDGRRLPGLQRRHWTVRNTNRVFELLAERTGDQGDRNRRVGGCLHLPRYDTEWWITFDRSEGIDGSEPRDPWLLPTIDSLVLYNGRGLPPELVRAQLAFAKTNGLSANIGARLPAGMAWYGGEQAPLAKRVIVDLGLRPWPITELCHGQLVARAGTCVMTNSGARTHEFFQIVHDPARLLKFEDLPGSEVRYVFLSVPKGLDEAVPFVITPDDAAAIFAMIRFAMRRFHDGGPIPETDPPRSLAGKCGRGRYAANAGERPLDPNRLNPLVQILFVGRHELEAYDLRHGFASYAEGAGVPIEIIAAWLHQKALDITRYYAQAPKATRDRWWLRFHTTVNLQEFQAAGATVLEAERAAALDEVGALTSVPGGTCVLLGECPVRFSCIGCRRNAPDPDKSGEVEDSMVAATALRDVWARNGRVKAVQEQERVIERHRTMLREMELITRYREMRDEVIEPGLATRVVSPVPETRR